jgi:putative adenylate-forming enzyme
MMSRPSAVSLDRDATSLRDEGNSQSSSRGRMPVVRAAADIAAAANRFARTRWGWRWRDRGALVAWQNRQIRAFLCQRLPQAPFYRALVGNTLPDPFGLTDLPIVDKHTHLTQFEALNTRGVRFDEAMKSALAAERGRDFTPTLAGDVTVGLSSGTSGRRALFLVSRRERLLWAASVLARMLDHDGLTRIAQPWRAPLRIAFFLRANSNLYTTLHHRRIDFSFYDLLVPFDCHLGALASSDPHVIVAPATVLRRLAEAQAAGAIRLRPQQVISVAETLEADDFHIIDRAFGAPGRPSVRQIYQATEGFLGYTCEAGTLHLNEECVHFEPEWLDGSRTRFQPIVTDFTRETQLIVRYRLDDVLLVREDGCSCGRASVALASIEGRRDEVLLLPARVDGLLRPIFPDFVRLAMALAGEHVRDYRIRQTDGALVVRLQSAQAGAEMAATQAVRAELHALFDQQAVRPPAIVFEPWRDEPAGDKRRRIARSVS